MLIYHCERCGIEVRRARGDEGRMRFCSIRCARIAQTMKPKAVRFWAKVQKTDGCWLWTGAKRSGTHTYGVLRTGPRSGGTDEVAHRVSWELHIGPIPPGLWVLHHCDNPPCVRPDHLYIGTASDNVADRQRRHRHWSHAGEHHPFHKLTEQDIRSIRSARAEGQLLREIAARYNITIGAVANIAARRSWRHVE